MSAISHLLASISPLLSTLENAIQEISHVPSEVDTLRKHLEQASEIVEKSIMVEKSLRSRYAATLNTISPVMVLPRWIILDVFYMAVHAEEETTSRPADISLVCRSWRDLAGSCAVLWTKVHVDATKVYMLENLSTKVKRVPIELDIQRKRGGDHLWMFNNKKMPRIGSLRMTLAQDYWRFVPFRLLEDGRIDTSDLKTLDLRMDPSIYRGHGSGFCNVSLNHINAPLLRTFKIQEFKITSMPNVPFHLTTLSICRTAMEYETLRQFLEHSPDLEELSIYSISFFRGDSELYEALPVTLPRLKRFALEATSYMQFVTLVLPLGAPGLESLSITVNFDGEDGDLWADHKYASILKSFLSRVSTHTLIRVALFSLTGIICEFIKVLDARYPNNNNNRSRGLEALTLGISTEWLDENDPENLCTRDHLRVLVETLATHCQPLRELHLSKALVGSEEFRRDLERWVGVLNIDTNRPYVT
ncbi:uncharacterized protein EI90DRAFT_3151616 [Cantharellus anzutake]|uniref:uncharacterized protein n=1 Tax=Cantharellus anzutake TaxID=1750568 RepID=UPI001908A2A8|nr:uncharacterized protein EI90DRAFT_3151616 [Cantharellus anzutake]KAF8339026.1 hypothetical protein EI90DRAFT_3151616 [Cantharellus anzutake]